MGCIWCKYFLLFVSSWAKTFLGNYAGISQNFKVEKQISWDDLEVSKSVIYQVLGPYLAINQSKLSPICSFFGHSTLNMFEQGSCHKICFSSWLHRSPKAKKFANLKSITEFAVNERGWTLPVANAFYASFREASNYNSNFFLNHRQQIILNNFTSNFCKRAIMHVYSHIDFLQKCNAEPDRFKMQIETNGIQIEVRLNPL